MPMPGPNSPWPPKAWQPAYDQYALNDAWLTGDVAAIARFAGNDQQAATHRHNGTGHRGGIVGAASRMFWGRPVGDGERSRVHLPIPADLATLASDLQYSDPPVTSFAETGETTPTDAAQARLDDILNSDAHHAMLNSMGEIKSALGASIIVPRWDKELEERVWLDYAAADTAIPTFRQGRLVDVTLWSEWQDGVHFWRHLEHHARGYIEHALFRGTKSNLGRRRPLKDHPETAVWAALVDDKDQIPTGIDRLTAGYLPNAPALAWRKDGALKDAGRSDFNQLIPIFDNADETWSSWMRDLKLGAGRLIVPESYLRSNGPGAGASFDLLQEMFVGLNVPGDPDSGMDLTPQQFQIRVQEHKDTLDGITEQILRKAGYSPASWGLGDVAGGTATATEIQHRERRTETSRSKKNLYDRMVLSRMGSVALELDGRLFPGKGGGRFDLNVVFPDISRVDPKTEAETIGLLKVANAISIETSVRRANPDWEPEAVDDEVERIMREQGLTAAPDPVTLGRVDDPTAPEDPTAPKE
ncbi:MULTISPECIES: phage portal protein [unclassified Leucobacter]|uniref:phage portal protein n=1 Tax=unclassified Leucobacter TaxID=2621730 RepID=UPI000620FCA2|nr:phage portal protein [Leucobacter sp. Ag1]KKI18723.1 hypothetical protein XM48_10600 [Leucobacter sp. Ag1]